MHCSPTLAPTGDWLAPRESLDGHNSLTEAMIESDSRLGIFSQLPPMSFTPLQLDMTFKLSGTPNAGASGSPSRDPLTVYGEQYMIMRRNEESVHEAKRSFAFL